MESHSLLLELGHVGWDFSGHGWFMVRLISLLVRKNLLQLVHLPIKAFSTTILKFSNDMFLPSFEQTI